RHSVTHIQLERLSPAEVSSFLQAVFDQDPSFRVVDALHSRTGGNPFFLEELVASAGEVPDHELDDTPLPWTVSELVRSEVDDLEPEVREMVSAASVLGRRVSFDLLATVTGASESELIARLRAAVDHGLLVETDPDVFSFHHELAREAIESGLLGRERRRLHEAAFDALRLADSRDHLALVHHARGAGRYDDMISEARLGAHESLALGSSYQALQLAETGLAEAEDDLDLLSVATRAAWLAGLVEDAVDHADRWLALARAADDVSIEAIDAGRSALEDPAASATARQAASARIWDGNIQLLEHEQRSVVQPNFDRFSRTFGALFSAGSSLSFEARGLRQELTYFSSFYLYSLGRGLPATLRSRAWPRVTRFDDRWNWIMAAVIPRFRRLDADATSV
ncbi:MAG: DUF2515 family protein, partial [Acidimicrobiales bacterium]